MANGATEVVRDSKRQTGKLKLLQTILTQTERLMVVTLKSCDCGEVHLQPNFSFSLLPIAFRLQSCVNLVTYENPTGFLSR